MPRKANVQSKTPPPKPEAAGFEHRQSSVSAAGVQKPAGVPASVFHMAQPPKRERACAPAFDPLALTIKKAVPIPSPRTGTAPQQAARYRALLDRMKPGDCVELSPILARGVASFAKAAKIPVSLRKLGESVVGVWRVK